MATTDVKQAPHWAPTAGMLLVKIGKAAERRFAEALKPTGLTPRHLGVLFEVQARPTSQQDLIKKQARMFFSMGPNAADPALRVLSPGETVKSPETHLFCMQAELDQIIQTLQNHVRRDSFGFAFEVQDHAMAHRRHHHFLDVLEADVEPAIEQCADFARERDRLCGSRAGAHAQELVDHRDRVDAAGVRGERAANGVVLHVRGDHDALDQILVREDARAIEDRLDDIDALVLTHGHEDHIGAVPFLLRQRPELLIVGSRFTLALVAATASWQARPGCGGWTVQDGIGATRSLAASVALSERRKRLLKLMPGGTGLTSALP